MSDIKNTLQIEPKKSSKYKKYLFISLLFFLLGGGGYGVYNYKKSNDIIKYKTVLPQKRTIVTKVLATGNLEPTNSVEVGIEVSGTIREVLVDYNDRVKAGAVMAKLDTTRLKSALDSSKAALLRYEANIVEAKASLEYAKNEYKRVEDIYSSTGGSYPSKKEVDEAHTTLQKAKANYDVALAQAKQASFEVQTNRYNLDRAVVLSPIDGIVLERKAEVGQTVVAAMQTPILFKMAKDLTKMRVILSVDEADIGEVKEGQNVEFSVDAYSDKKFNGVITQLRLNSEIVNGVVTYDTVVEVDNAELLLRPGMTVSAYITTSISEDMLSIPNSALRFTPPNEDAKQKDATKHIWVFQEKKAIKKEIKTSKSDGVYTAVTDSNLSMDDLIIIGIEKNNDNFSK
ncbi:MAG: HlyD family secretion protein [Campylobacterota bacterium]|nr:HlyD family secretion protein [Campylobacterota bacterium]